jgi:hypothetical protein
MVICLTTAKLLLTYEEFTMPNLPCMIPQGSSSVCTRSSKTPASYQLSARKVHERMREVDKLSIDGGTIRRR